MTIDPDAAQLFAEAAGTDLGKIVVESDKMLKNLPEGVKQVKAEDVEKNVGISRQFSVFELTKALSYRDARKALHIAARVGEAPRFALPMAVSPLFTHFNRILKLDALIATKADQATKLKVLGVNPYFMGEYEAAARNYPVDRCSRVISLLCEYDYKGKGGDVGEATPAELLVELVSKIINI